MKEQVDHMIFNMESRLNDFSEALQKESLRKQHEAERPVEELEDLEASNSFPGGFEPNSSEIEMDYDSDY